MHKSTITAALAATLLLTFVAARTNAQMTHLGSSESQVIPIYDSAHEITLPGNIEKVATQPEWGAPIGTHLVVSIPGGSVDVHLGSFVTKDATALSLRTGEAVVVVGAMATIEGKQVLLARTLTVGGKTRIIRNERGFLVRPGPVTARSKATASGGM